MPIPDHDFIDELTAILIGAYADAESSLLRQMARRIQVGINDPDWRARQAVQLAAFRRDIDVIVARLNRTNASQVPKIIQEISERADAIIDRETAALPLAEAALRSPEPRDGAAEQIRVSVAPLSARMEFVASSTYQNIIGHILDAELGTRRQVAQHALNAFASRGITGFRDRSGRSWELASYVEMATRTIAANHQIRMQAEQLVALGLDLVIVSDAPQECKLCRPYEGKVLSISGNNVGNVEVANPISGESVRVHVMTSLAKATSAGLHHPNCRHSESAYLPGVTKRPTKTTDIEGDAARQKLRYLERQKRAWLRRQAVAITKEDTKRAETETNRYNSLITEHVAMTTAKRQRSREQITAAR